MIIYNSNEACIIWVEKRKYIYLAVDGFLESHKIKAFTEQLINICKTQDVQGIIFDTTKITIIKPKDLKWINEEVIPKLRIGKIKKVAFLYPENSFGSLSIDRIKQNVIVSEAKIFRKLEDAEKWLFSADEMPKNKTA